MDYDAFKTSFIAAMNCKKLKKTYYSKLKLWHSQPNILNFIVAYNGPAQMKTIYEWVKRIEDEFSVSQNELPVNKEDRMKIVSSGIDGVFVLGKGFIHFDNFCIDNVAPKIRERDSWLRWVFRDIEVGGLLLLFLNLAQIICTPRQNVINLVPYLLDTDEPLLYGK